MLKDRDRGHQGESKEKILNDSMSLKVDCLI